MLGVQRGVWLLWLLQRTRLNLAHSATNYDFELSAVIEVGANSFCEAVRAGEVRSQATVQAVGVGRDGANVVSKIRHRKPTRRSWIDETSAKV
jgi:hypothetical protein